MGSFIDLTGKKFNRLTVINRDLSVPTAKGAYWICKCDCGTIVSVCGRSLRSGETKSCGCWNREKGSLQWKKDITGQRFGRLVALYCTNEKSGHCYKWHCRCDCGRELDVPINSLTTGGTRSCGCLFHANIKGMRFGRLVALNETGKREGNNVVWHCICDCGNYIDVPSTRLLRGMTTSCGCYNIERIKETNTRWHSEDEKRLANILHNMKQRCYNKNDASYQRYGGRGITVCEEWMKNSRAFVEWALAHGYRQGLSINRVDNNGNYSPSNCVWSTQAEQMNNTSNNRLFEIDGSIHTLSEWASIAGIDPNDLWGHSDAAILSRLDHFITKRRSAVGVVPDVFRDQIRSVSDFLRTQGSQDKFLMWAYGLDDRGLPTL